MWLGPAPDKPYHIDRCLSCLSCMTTCPSGVDYMHLVDLARIRIDHKRSPAQKTTRWLLAKTLPSPTRFRIALLFGWLAPLSLAAYL